MTINMVSVRDFAAAYYGEHRDELDYAHSSFLGAEALRVAAEQFKLGFGIEGFSWDCGRHGLSYINMGDTYENTVLFDSEAEEFSVGTWGDFVENLENEGVILD